MAATRDEALKPTKSAVLAHVEAVAEDQSDIQKLVTKFRGTPFVPVQAAACLGKTVAETILILTELHEAGCCGCPVNDGGRNLFTMCPQEVRQYNGL